MTKKKRPHWRAEATVLRLTLEDLAENGTRHDLNPTLILTKQGDEGTKEVIERLYRYIASMDSYVRQIALNTLKQADKSRTRGSK